LGTYQVILLEFCPHQSLMCANIQCPTSGLRTVEFACGGGLSTKGTFQVYMLATESDIIRGIFHY